MPKKPITWIGSVVILSAGIFSCWALIQFRNGMIATDSRFLLVTVAVFVAPVLGILAIFLWYYFNERV